MFNDKKTAFNCRVCGHNQGFEPWGKDGKTATFEICSCCGVEFGYEDFTELGLREFRENWLKNGAKWFSPKKKPEGWSLEEQMKGIPEKYK